MQVMLGPADAVDARFFGGGTWNGVGGGGTCQARVHLMQMMLASWHLPSESLLDAHNAPFGGGAPAKREST